MLRKKFDIRFDIREEVDVVFMLEKPAALTKELNFTMHVDDDVPKVVKGFKNVKE